MMGRRRPQGAMLSARIATPELARISCAWSTCLNGQEGLLATSGMSRLTGAGERSRAFAA